MGDTHKLDPRDCVSLVHALEPLHRRANNDDPHRSPVGDRELSLFGSTVRHLRFKLDGDAGR
jgi:hypothetical protein